jgi:DNA mismatch repair protein MLH1
MGISVASNATTVDRIRQIHGSTIANELIKISVENQRWGFKCGGWVSNANCNVKRTTLLLFINHRSVESTPIKKAVEQTYAAFLPKGGHPFVYLSLEIDPGRVDVNVHPTKREVNFLNEEEIIEEICDEIRASLGKVDTSRTFLTQTLLPGSVANIPTISASTERSSKDDEQAGGATPKTPAPKPTSQRPYENNLVRTDSRVRKITSMLPPGSHTPGSRQAGASSSKAYGLNYEYTDREPVLCRLSSIKELRTSVREAMHNELTDTIATHTFVGVVDESRRIAAIQGGVKLFLVDYGLLCTEYFYQLGLTDFGNMGSIRFSPPLNLRDLLSVGAAEERDALPAEERDSINWDSVVDTVATHLVERRDMLAEYFSVEISDEGELHTIPLLMKGYTPSIGKLPRFLLNLGPRVNWDEEKPCFHSFLTELASFYAPEALPVSRRSRSTDPNDRNTGTTNDDSGPVEAGSANISGEGGESLEVEEEEEDPEIEARRAHLLTALENVLFPAMKGRLMATKGMLRGVVEVANLKGLYRVFERC